MATKKTAAAKPKAAHATKTPAHSKKTATHAKKAATRSKTAAKTAATHSKATAAHARAAATHSKAAATHAKKDAPHTKVTASRAKAPASRAKSTASSGAEVGIRVRMYRVGFGDFFLVSIGDDAGRAHILIDCGVHSGTTGKGDIGTIQAAVADMAAETGSELALLIMTHRHADHISGFARCRDQFEKFKVGAVWMSAWENEYDPKAKKLQAALTAAATNLQTHLAAREDDDGVAMRDMMYNATGLGAAAADAPRGGSNAAALDLLKNGLKVTPTYYQAGDAPKLPKALSDLGVAAQVLGPPPVDDVTLMKLMDLTKGVGQYLDSARDNDQNTPFKPFGDAWSATAADYDLVSFEEWDPRETVSSGKTKHKPLASPDTFHARMESVLASVQPRLLFTAAKALDSFLNNQSLVLLFTYRGKKLLFVGDAQAGNWEHWLYDTDKPNKAPSGAIATEGASILSSIDFYKVGHHGSTNATPIAAVKAMRENIVAMCSTQPDVYGSPSKGTEVPRGPLLDDLEKSRTLVRSDQLEINAGGIKVPRGEGAPAELGTPSSGRLVAGKYSIDYFL